jgi:predicted Zn-dependent protease
VEKVLIYTSNFKDPKTGKQLYSLEDNAGSNRCGEGDPPRYGCIGIGIQLIKSLSDDALAGVLSHELGHLEKGHIGSALVKRSLGVAKQAPSLLCGSGGDPVASLILCGIGAGISMASMGVAAQGAAIGRDLEREADHAAWERLADSGYCAGQVLTTTFSELSKLKSKGGTGGIFSTHPSHSERRATADHGCGKGTVVAGKDPLLASAHATTLVKHKEWKGLLELSQQWTKDEPSNAIPWAFKGTAHLKLTQPEEAVSAYQEAVRLKPDYAEAWHNMGSAYATLKQYDKAITAYQESVRIKPNLVSAWINLGVSFYNQSQIDKVREVHRKLLELDSVKAEQFRTKYLRDEATPDLKESTDPVSEQEKHSTVESEGEPK